MHERFNSSGAQCTRYLRGFKGVRLGVVSKCTQLRGPLCLCVCNVLNAKIRAQTLRNPGRAYVDRSHVEHSRSVDAHNDRIDVGLFRVGKPYETHAASSCESRCQATEKYQALVEYNQLALEDLEERLSAVRPGGALGVSRPRRPSKEHNLRCFCSSNRMHYSLRLPVDYTPLGMPGR